MMEKHKMRTRFALLTMAIITGAVPLDGYKVVPDETTQDDGGTHGAE